MTLWLPIAAAHAQTAWEPPARFSHAEIVTASNAVLRMPETKIGIKEEIIRIRALELDWDIGAMIYAPADGAETPRTRDGRKIGVFLLHGGASDYRSMDGVARLLAGKFGYKVVSMTYPGNLNLLDSSRKWPGVAIHSDGTVRTPIWNKDKLITPDQYEIVENKEDSMRRRYGTLILACAKEGTEFYHRMAGWPVAFEEGGKEFMRRFLPKGEYAIYGDGHSTDGPFTLMLSQRVPNFVGVIGMESSPFGYMYAKNLNAQGQEETWDIPFNCLRMSSWRSTAHYMGYEVLEKEGPEALKRLPMLMEEVFEQAGKSNSYPQFKAENTVHFNGIAALTQAARATARRLNLSAAKTEALVQRYVGYTRELSGSGIKPVPPALLGITTASRDHTPKTYREIYLPTFAAMKPAPKVRMVEFEGGTHSYMSPEQDLPMDLAPAVVKLWHDAIVSGFFQVANRDH